MELIPASSDHKEEDQDRFIIVTKVNQRICWDCAIVGICVAGLIWGTYAYTCLSISNLPSIRFPQKVVIAGYRVQSGPSCMSDSTANCFLGYVIVQILGHSETCEFLQGTYFNFNDASEALETSYPNQTVDDVYFDSSNHSCADRTSAPRALDTQKFGLVVGWVLGSSVILAFCVFSIMPLIKNRIHLSRVANISESKGNVRQEEIKSLC
jgi:hypothetical protein